jgi:uncharacterized membrane protein SirB2
MLVTIVNIIAYIIFAVFMIAQRFATRKSNFRFMLGLSIASFIIKIVGELVCNLVLANNSAINTN